MSLSLSIVSYQRTSSVIVFLPFFPPNFHQTAQNVVQTKRQHFWKGGTWYCALIVDLGLDLEWSNVILRILRSLCSELYLCS